jgi:recombination protein RecT
MARDLARRAQQSVAQQGDGRDLRQQLVKMQEQFQRAMPRGVEAVQLIRDVMTCMQQTPKLAQCDIPSVLGAAMTCAQLGLRPGVGALGQAWILPFYDNKTRGQRAQLIIGYKGYVELGHRSDRIASLHSRIVYANDLFDVEYGAAEDRWTHKPCLDGERGAAKLFYAVGRLANGGYSLTDPMTVADMEKHRDKFAMARNREGQIVGPWRDHFDAMGQKTMLLRLMALMPKSTEMQRAMDNDGSVRVDLSAGAIDTPTHIDGEVIGDPVDEPLEEREPIDVRGPAAAGEQPVTEITMATSDQLDRLAQIQKSEKYDSDDEWFAYLGDAAGVKARRTANLTYDEAAAVISLFDGPGA